MKKTAKIIFGVIFPIGMLIAIGILVYKTRNDPFPPKPAPTAR